MAQNTVNTTNPANQPVGANPNMQAQAVTQQANGPTNQMSPAARPVDLSSPQYDVKNVKKGVESFMVSFNFATTPITQVADYIITSASKHNASDIHFDPRENGMMVRFRIDGDCQDYTFIPLAYERNLTTRLKLLANMNITESRLPQDGAIKGTFGGTYLDMRVSALPLNEGEKIVIRILDYTRSLQGIDSLGFNESNLIKLKRMMGIPNGIILTTGATGSGKSTTTYSILQGLNKPEVNIITVEDPIEMNIEGINQVQVNSEIGMTFAAALRSILRQDPNVILIGEIRDSETAQIAVRSAITGHLVLSTIHTNNSLATVERLLDMDVERYLLSTAMVGIISQRLAKKLCPNCMLTREASAYEKKVFKTFLNKDVTTLPVANPKGCEKCRKGYKGRIAVHEVLEFDDELRSALNNTSLTKEELAKMVYNGKTISLLQDGLGKILENLTTFDEIYRVIEIETDNPQEDALYGQNMTTSLDKTAETVAAPTAPVETAQEKVQNENIQQAAVNVTAVAATSVGVQPPAQEVQPEAPAEATVVQETPAPQPEPVVEEQPTNSNTADEIIIADESGQPQIKVEVTAVPAEEKPEDPVVQVAEDAPQPLEPGNRFLTGSDTTSATSSVSNKIIETPKEEIADAIPELNLADKPKTDSFEIPDSLKKDEISDSAPTAFFNLEIN